MIDQKNIQLKESLNYLKRLLILIRAYWHNLMKGIALSIIIGIVSMLVPYLTKLLIDRVYPSKDVDLMNSIIISILSVNIASITLTSLQGYYNLVIQTKLSNSVSLMFFNHIQNLKYRFFSDHSVGEIISRFGDVTNSIQTVNQVLQTILVNSAYLLFVPIILALLQWKLAIISFISLPVTIISISVLGKYVRKYWKKSAESFADFTGFQVETLSNIRFFKSMALEKFVFKKSREQIEKAVNMQLKAGGIHQIVDLIQKSLQTFNMILIMWLGWNLIISQEMSLGDYIAFSAYMGYLYNPLAQIVNLFSNFQQSSVSLTRMYEYLNVSPEQDPNSYIDDNQPIKNYIKGNIELNKIRFFYSPGKLILNDINLKIQEGSITTIIGESGSGKTTLLRLLLGLEQPIEGEIIYDKIPLSTFQLFELRKQVTVVWQEFSIIKDTLWNNLTIGLETINTAKVEEVISICKLRDLISKLSNGVHTYLSESGNNLSGGQKQIIAIARSLLRESQVYIFDEATSNIDIKTEVNLLKSVFKYLEGKTIIFVTHRASCTHLSDQICLLDSGNISTIGSHSELLRSNTRYQQMFQTN